MIPVRYAAMAARPASCILDGDVLDVRVPSA